MYCVRKDHEPRPRIGYLVRTEAASMAHALKFHTVVSGNTVALPDLGAFEGKRVEITVVEDDLPADANATLLTQRPLGLLRGQFIVPDDFDDPLPADLQALFEGDGDEL